MSLQECLNLAEKEYGNDKSECRNQNFMMKTVNCKKKNLELLNIILKERLRELQRKGPTRSVSRSRSRSKASGKNRRHRTRRRRKKCRKRRTRGSR